MAASISQKRNIEVYKAAARLDNLSSYGVDGVNSRDEYGNTAINYAIVQMMRQALECCCVLGLCQMHQTMHLLKLLEIKIQGAIC
jgi:hypothetical protein